MKSIIKNIIRSVFVFFIFTILLSVNTYAAGWTAQIGAGQRNWTSIASNSSGTIIYGLADGYLYKSINSGTDWTQLNNEFKNWSSLTSSEDGSVLFVIDGDSYRVLKSLDGGNNWSTTTSPQKSWYYIASSKDSTKIAGIIYGDYIYISSDGGDTWVEKTVLGQKDWCAISISPDGMNIAAGVCTGYIYTSTDGGNTWTEQQNSGVRDWSSISLSSDGKNIVGTTWGGYIYTSTDGGNTWTEQQSAGQGYWWSVASDISGFKLAAIQANDGYLYTSSDGGNSWLEYTDLGKKNWSSVIYSINSNKIISAANPGYVYMYDSTPFIPDVRVWRAELNTLGKNWTNITASTDGTKIYALGSGYVYSSNDEGKNWTPNSFLGYKNWSYINTSNDGSKIVAADMYGYLYVSINSGLTWTQQTALGQKEWAQASYSGDGSILVAAARDNFIYTSNDNGNSWVEHTESGKYTTWDLLKVSYSGDKIILKSTEYISHFAQIYHLHISNDFGNTWSIQDTSNIWDIDMSDDGSIIYAATYDSGTLKSSNGGIDWGNMSYIYPNFPPGSASEISTFGDGSDLLIRNENGVYLTTDSGNTWIDKSSDWNFGLNNINYTFDGSKIIGFCHNNDYICIYKNPEIPELKLNPHTILNSNSVDLSAFINTKHTIRGFEYGTTTSYGQIYTENGDYYINDFITTISDLELNTIYHYRAFATNDIGTGYSEDGTFIVQYQAWDEQINSGQYSWIDIDSSLDGNTLIASSGEYVYLSKDRGVNWLRQDNLGITNNSFWSSVSVSGDGTRFAVIDQNNEKVYLLIDNNENWNEIISPAIHNIIIKFSRNGNKLMLSGLADQYLNDYLYISDDDGESWVKLENAGQKSWYGFALSNDGSKMIAGNRNNGYVYTSANSGQTWTEQIRSGQHYWGIFEGSDDLSIIYATNADDGYLYKSTDGGITWNQINQIQNIIDLSVSSDGMKIIVTDNANIFSSIDGGVNWLKHLGIPNYSWRTVTSNGSGEFMASGGIAQNIWSYYNALPQAQNVAVEEQ